MWKTVYEAKSQQLNTDPDGSGCPSKAREGKNKHFYMNSVLKCLSWCCRHKTHWICVCVCCQKNAARAKFCVQSCVFEDHFLCIDPDWCGQSECCLFTAVTTQTSRTDRVERVVAACMKNMTWGREDERRMGKKWGLKLIIESHSHWISHHFYVSIGQFQFWIN